MNTVSQRVLMSVAEDNRVNHRLGEEMGGFSWETAGEMGFSTPETGIPEPSVQVTLPLDERKPRVILYDDPELDAEWHARQAEKDARRQAMSAPAGRLTVKQKNANERKYLADAHLTSLGA